MKPQSREYWGTERELSYLPKIGLSHLEVKRRLARGSLSQKTLLQNYIRAAERRHNWGNINKKEVIAKAKHLIAVIDKK